MDMTLTLGEIVIASTIVFSAGGFYAATREQAKQAKKDKEAQAAQAKKDNDALQGDITDIKADLKTLNKVVMDVALQNQRLDNQAERITQIERRSDERLTSLERRWDEVRRGEGLITRGA